MPQLVQALDALGERAEVGQQPAQPAVAHVRHADALGLLLDGLLALLLGADEQHPAAALGGVPEERIGLVDEDGRLLEVDDVDAAALAEDVRLHLGVPAAGLVAEVDAAGEQVLHADRGLG